MVTLPTRMLVAYCHMTSKVASGRQTDIQTDMKRKFPCNYVLHFILIFNNIIVIGFKCIYAE